MPLEDYPPGSPPTPALEAHFDLVQESVVSKAKEYDPRHANIKGRLRELLVSGFLRESISPQWDIAERAEIINRDSRSRDGRDEFDIVVYNSLLPGIFPPGGRGKMVFLEAVSSFIEVKSKLTETDLARFASSTKRVKEATPLPVQRFNASGMIETPRPYAFVVAFDGPKRMDTVARWFANLEAKDDYGLDPLRTAPPEDRAYFPHRFVDGVFILNRGYVYVDALPFESVVAGQPEDVYRRHVVFSGDGHELLLLWAIICQANVGLYWNRLDVTDYLGATQFERRVHEVAVNQQPRNG